jgi:crotonobetainyl-CoA:carnitine CoA-transferase CaiB-like acyl-CoA transferase
MTLLCGYQVLDLTGLAGAYATKLLSDLGADVVRVEGFAEDQLRDSPPFVAGEPGPDRSLEFLHFSTNKRSMLVDPAKPQGADTFAQLLGGADVLVESLPVGTLDAWGFSREAMRERFPRLVHASITAFGSTGPKARWKGTDLTAAAAGGLLYLTGEPDRPPVRLGADQVYHLGSMYAASGVLIALFERRATGRGAYLDISLQEAAASITGDRQPAIMQTLTGIPPVRTGNQTAHFFPYRGLPCADGWVTVCALEPAQWSALADWVFERTRNGRVLDARYQGRGHERARFAKELLPILTAFTSSLTRRELSVEGQRRGIPIMPVNTVEDLVVDPQLQDRQYFQALSHDVIGASRYLGAPYRFTGGGWTLRHAAPHRGQEWPSDSVNGGSAT